MQGREWRRDLRAAPAGVLCLAPTGGCVEPESAETAHSVPDRLIASEALLASARAQQILVERTTARKVGDGKKEMVDHVVRARWCLAVGCFVSMPPRSHSNRAGVLERWKHLSQPRGWSASGEFGEVPIQMSLIEIAASGGDLGDSHERRPCLEHVPCPLEAHHAGSELRTEPELVGESARQVLAAPPDARCDRPDRSHPSSVNECPPRGAPLGG